MDASSLVAGYAREATVARDLIGREGSNAFTLAEHRSRINFDKEAAVFGPMSLGHELIKRIPKGIRM